MEFNLPDITKESVDNLCDHLTRSNVLYNKYTNEQQIRLFGRIVVDMEVTNG